MEKGTTYVGVDVHKRSIALAMRDPSGAVSEQTIPHEPRAILRWLRKIKRETTGPVRCAYEAGPNAIARSTRLSTRSTTSATISSVISSSLSPRYETICPSRVWTSHIEPSPSRAMAPIAQAEIRMPSDSQISARRSDTVASAIRRRSWRWHRERTMKGVLSGSVVAKTKRLWRGRLFECLEERVERRFREHVDLVHDEDPGLPGRGGVTDRLDQLARVVDTAASIS